MPYVVPTGGSAPSGQTGATDPSVNVSPTGGSQGGSSGNPPDDTEGLGAAQNIVAPDVTAFGWIVGWAVFIFLLWSAAQTRIGYALIYWLAVAALVLLCLTQYRWIVAVLAPITGAVVTPPTVTYEPGATPNSPAPTISTD